MFWRLTLYDANGVADAGDGGTVYDDGTWVVPESYEKVNSAPGAYKVSAACLAGGVVLFTYPDEYFTVTG
jgi:hypothetical protein